ncbi:SPARC-like protein 1 [Salarias fasciatus]|uniref:SPARC-like protein 1 n=1 Tax=Salarias fasciatus TaxID=181472 RepID=A0A672G4Z7_SALFA|nr:SPARC-like protein 1 [Salarias fasciatus]
MRACLVFLCLLATALPLTVTSKPHGKHHGLHKALQTAKEKDLITEETNKPQILPTVITFEASSQEQEDEELSSQDNANKEEEKSTEKRGKSTAVLLSEEELVDLLQGEEEEEDAEREQEEEGREGEDAGKEVTEDDKTEAEEKLDESSETDEEVMEEAEEERAVEDVIEEEVEKISSEERMEEPAGKDEQVTPFEDMDGSAESEIPVNLDYAADSGILQPLHKTHTETLKSTPEIGISETEEKKSNEKQPADMDSDHEQNMQQTEAADSEEVLDQNKDKEQPNKQAELNVKKKEPETNVDPQEPKSNAELESKSRPSGKEEEKSKNESGSHTKGKGKKQKKNQRARKHSVQRDEAQQGVIQSQQDAPQSDGSSTDNTVHKAKRRRAGKWGPLVGVNPVQIRATVELFPRSRPSLGGGAHLSEAPADPCDNFRCKRGKTCKLDEDNKPGCVCQQPSECPPSVNEFDHVCGTDNKTYDTSCELFATKCNLEGTKKGHRLHLDYTGSCKVIPSCEDSELVQFPLRMRDWLKNVLLQLYEHDVVTPGFLTPKQHFRVKKIFESERRLHAGDHSVELLAQDFEKNYNMYIYPVHWQFAQLDQHPSDRFLSHSELAPLRVPLVPMEHCTSRFFQECDADKDKQVSFKEWTSCFGIKNEDMDANLLF